MRLVTFEVQTLLGRFERIGALAHGTVVDLTSASSALLAESQEASAAQRHAEGLVPPDMIRFLEGGPAARELADR
ncbi:MAG: fumarylacetoacetate hydrolase family protein, partial [Chloroflexi bacterium]|nr:fumarylacetoacetate hydrolase family protein [Chloroflexota bacterium]